MQKILVTGSNGRFGKILQNLNIKKFIFKNKQQLNILSSKSISNNLKRYKPSHILHLAGLSRPMIIHEKDIVKSKTGYLSRKDLFEKAKSTSSKGNHKKKKPNEGVAVGITELVVFRGEYESSLVYVFRQEATGGIVADYVFGYMIEVGLLIEIGEGSEEKWVVHL